MKRKCSRATMLHLFRILLAAVFTLCCGVPADAATPLSQQASFASPEEAVHALAAALKGGDSGRLADILGPNSANIVSSGDAVTDRAGREEFVGLYEAGHRIELVQQDKAVLYIGSQDYPVPIPVVKRGSSWIFDTDAGREEILNRRIGKNELEAIEILHAYVEAQREYAARVRTPGSTPEYAQQILSSPGRRDGLYWEAQEGEEESPMGPVVAQAAREGYSRGKWPVPFYGYYFRILKGQGANAPGGARDYVVKGRMVRGFALVAYPAKYGASGIMTFMVNQDGTVYQKDLGPDTPKLVPAMRVFDPDKSWKEVGGDENSLPTVSDLSAPSERDLKKGAQ